MGNCTNLNKKYTDIDNKDTQLENYSIVKTIDVIVNIKIVGNIYTIKVPNNYTILQLYNKIKERLSILLRFYKNGTIYHIPVTSLNNIILKFNTTIRFNNTTTLLEVYNLNSNKNIEIKINIEQTSFYSLALYIYKNIDNIEVKNKDFKILLLNYINYHSIEPEINDECTFFYICCYPEPIKLEINDSKYNTNYKLIWLET